MDLTNVAHLHLLLNHVPTVGLAIGLGLLLLAYLRRSDHLKHASLEVLFVIALLTFPAYLSGVAAQAHIQDRPEVSAFTMEVHHDAALLAFVFMEITGLFAWLGLWQYRRAGGPLRSTMGAVLLLSVVTMALMALAGNVGGEIRHPEILPSQVLAEAGPSTAWLKSSDISAVVTGYPWVWPAAETLHFIGMCMAFGVLLMVNLRILGMMRAVPFSSVHRLLPWGILGFGLNMITGMLFFIAASGQYVENYAFYWKVLLMGLAGANFLYLTVFDKTYALGPGRDAGALDKLVAVLALGTWVGVIYWGRMLPFLGNAF